MTKTGTPIFKAPELFLQQTYDVKIDIWSAGVVFYMMLTGDLPFESESVPNLIHLITGDYQPNYEHKAFEQVSKQAIDLLVQMLTKDPDYRPSAKQCLQHAWFDQIDIGD